MYREKGVEMQPLKFTVYWILQLYHVCTTDKVVYKQGSVSLYEKNWWSVLLLVQDVMGRRGTKRERERKNYWRQIRMIARQERKGMDGTRHLVEDANSRGWIFCIEALIILRLFSDTFKIFCWAVLGILCMHYRRQLCVACWLTYSSHGYFCFVSLIIYF